MKRVYKYGFFVGMDPVCPERMRQYPDIDLNDPTDLPDAEHQWAYGTRVEVMQRCFEGGCDAVRPTPLDAYPHEAQMFIMRNYMEGKR